MQHQFSLSLSISFAMLRLDRKQNSAYVSKFSKEIHVKYKRNNLYNLIILTFGFMSTLAYICDSSYSKICFDENKIYFN